MTSQLIIKIIGKNPDYFLKKLIAYSINIYSLEKDKNYLIVTISEKDYKKIQKMKTSYKIIIIDRIGKSKIHYYLLNYWYILLFLILGITLINGFSHCILEIEIVHPNQKIIQIVKEDLKELGIAPYHLKVSYSNKERIKKKLLEKEKDLLEWIEIEEKGTKYIVTLEERKKNMIHLECQPRSIISKKNAIIMEIHATSGEIVKKKGDYVSKGDTIISGFIYNKDDVVAKRCSIGTVYGETWYRVKVLLPKEEKEKSYYNDKSIGFGFLFFTKEWLVGRKYSMFEKSEYNIIESKIVPIKMGVNQYQKIKWNKKIFSSKELEEKALDLAEKKIQESFQREEKVLLKKVLKKIEKNSKIEVEVFFKVKENITDYLDISLIENQKEE